ncbi:hypothetical protein [Streptomyces sparsogenes]|nr:hypothetical protein [Streptomyces sparsogenes]
MSIPFKENDDICRDTGCLAFIEDNWTDMRPHSRRLAAAPPV